MTARVHIFLITILALSTFPAAAEARSIEPYDSTYGVGGTHWLRSHSPRLNQTLKRCETVRGGALAIDAELDTGAKRPLFATAILPRYRTPRSATSSARWRFHNVPRREAVSSSDFAADGSLVYVTAAAAGDEIASLRIFRSLRNGRSDTRFGGDGQIVFRVGEAPRKLDWLDPEVTALTDGGLLLRITGLDGMKLIRFSRTGHVVTKWADGGIFRIASVAAIPMARAIGDVAETADGRLIVATSPTFYAAAPQPSALTKLTPGGAIDTSYGDGGFWLPPAPTSNPNVVPYASSGSIVRFQPAADGRVVVALTDEAVDVGSSFIVNDFRLAVVGANGQTIATTPIVDTDTIGSGNGFPDAAPRGLTATSGGAVFVNGSFQYGKYPSTLGVIVSWPDASNPAISSRSFGGGLFRVDDFEPSPDGEYVYACGATTKANRKQNEPLRDRIAIRRIKV